MGYLGPSLERSDRGASEGVGESVGVFRFAAFADADLYGGDPALGDRGVRGVNFPAGVVAEADLAPSIKIFFNVGSATGFFRGEEGIGALFIVIVDPLLQGGLLLLGELGKPGLLFLLGSHVDGSRCQ